MSMAKNKLLATEPAPSGEALLGGKPAGASKERRVSVWKDVLAGIVSNKAALASAIFILLLRPSRSSRSSSRRCCRTTRTPRT